MMPTMELFGGVETGGTWCVCAVGRGPEELEDVAEFRTGEPGETLERVAAFFERRSGLAAIGVGSFGPLDVDPDSPTWGYVTTTPKPGWQHTNLGQWLRDRLRVPVAFDLDVTAAAIGEHRWGGGRGMNSLCYLTVGTGIGAGLLAEGRPVHGLVHPEVGHIRVPHDVRRDSFGGSCPVHGDCWEGLASGDAIAQRWGCDAAELPDEHEAWELEAEYLALGILSIVLIASPERVVAGGGVMERPGLLSRTARRLSELVGGYLQTPLLGEEVERYLIAPELGDRAGVLGAIAMAQGAGGLLRRP
jgi:fructokinase